MTKSSTPPVLPERKLQRVLAIARADSLGVVVCSSLSLLLSLPAQQWVFAAFSALALVAGAMEWHGHQRLRGGFFEGMHWLIGAQACLYTIIVGYAFWRWKHFDAELYWAELPALAQERFTTQMREAQLDPVADRELLLRTMNILVCSLLIILSTLYQGGLSLWYQWQRAAVAAALENPSTDESSAG